MFPFESFNNESPNPRTITNNNSNLFGEVLIEVTIKVKSKNQERAEDALEDINVAFDVTKNSIRAATLLDNNRCLLSQD